MHNPLSIEAIAEGYYLREPDDHIIELWYRGKKLAAYSQSGITMPVLEQEISSRLIENKN